PSRMRFGIQFSTYFGAAAARLVCAVLIRATSRLIRRIRAVFSIWPVAFWNLRLNCSFLSLVSSSVSWSAVIALTSLAFISRTSLLAKPRHEARLDRKLRGGKHERLFGGRTADAVDLEQHAAGLYPAGPIFGRALARTH